MELSECFEFVETFQKRVSDLLLFYFFVGGKTLSSGCRPLERLHKLDLIIWCAPEEFNVLTHSTWFTLP